MKTHTQFNQLIPNYVKTLAPMIRWSGMALWLGLLSLAWADDPNILTQPTSQTVSPGENVMFYVRATTTNPPKSFQWQHSDTNLHGAAADTLRLTNVVAEHGGDYRVIVANALGHSVTSQVATLTVAPATFIRINEGPGGTESFASISAAWADYDGDGYPDLVIANSVSSGTPNNQFWHNDGNGTFTKITTNSPALAIAPWWYPYWIDYDDDGDLDLHVLAAGSDPDHCYRNDGNGAFTPVSPEFVKTVPYGSSSGELCGWSDFDGDGCLDVFIARYNANDLFFRGSPGGVFRSMTANDVGPLVSASSYQVGATFDYDNDGWQDLLVTPASGTCRLYHNEGHGLFRQVTERAPADPYVWNYAVGDYNNDGNLDLFAPAAEDGYRGRLYRNDGRGNFTNVAEAAGVNRPLNAFFATWADYDNDGNLDLFITTGTYFGPPQTYGTDNVMFRNNGDGTFTSVDIGSPLRDGIRRDSPNWVDYDNDGFLDFFLANGNGVAERNYLYRNNLPATGNANHWIKVRLHGRASNSMGVGAKVRVTASIGGKTVTQLRQITVPGSVTQEDYLAHFGLGDATSVTTLRIEWPSGIVQEIADVAANQFLTVTEQQLPPAAPPQVTVVGRGTDGAFQATVACTTPNVRCVLEASTNLVQWSKVQVRTNTLPGIMEFSDSRATHSPARFYRVVVP